MKGVKGGSCAIVLVLLFIAGCAVPEYFQAFFFQSSADGDRVIAGSVDNVSLSIQGSLRRLGLQFDVTEEPGLVRIASRSASGNRFVLILKQEQTDRGVFTRVHMEWEQNKDERTHTQVLAHIDAETKK